MDCMWPQALLVVVMALLVGGILAEDYLYQSAVVECVQAGGSPAECATSLDGR